MPAPPERGFHGEFDLLVGGGARSISTNEVRERAGADLHVNAALADHDHCVELLKRHAQIHALLKSVRQRRCCLGDENIAAAVAQAGPIDVLLNNAGIGWLNAVEGTPIETAHEIFQVNLFGTIAMMQAVLPGMRERGSGAIVNIGSSSTLKPLPLLSVYRASKAAVNALTESAALELAEFGIRACVVLPGMAPGTSFADNARARVAAGGFFPQPYAAFAGQTLAALQDAGGDEVTTARDVAEVVYRAATDPTCPTFVPAGADAIAWFEDK